MENNIERDSIKYPEVNSSYLYRIVITISIGGFLFNFVSSTMTVGILFLKEYFKLSPAMAGFVMGSVKLGSILGPVLGLWLADYWGRNKSMMISAWCIFISAIGCALSLTVWDLILWRFITGIGVGLIMVVAPIYIAELSPSHMRSSLVNINQLAIVIGIIIAIFTDYLLSFNGYWRLMFASAAIPSLLLIIGLIFTPKSPRWLALKNKTSEALNILSAINGRQRAQFEINQIMQSLRHDTGNIKELLKPGIKFSIYIGIGLMVFSQINGINMMLSYGPAILMGTGISSPSDAILHTLPNYILILIATILSFKLISKYPRKVLLVSTVSCMAFANFLMGLVLYFKMPATVLLVPMLIGVISFTVGFAPLTWVIVSEIFPTNIRGKAMAVVGIFLHGASYVCLWVFPVLTDFFDKYYNSTAGVFWIFTAICFICVLFAWKLVPETKGLSLEEISEFWNKK
ncbi:MAG: sugar porter family MFS transporter [Prolixibacteraceae bacterium]|jgi:sugar porter (SP) family MFS transporter|nr:sugar porter family MFS transporter [Prolixibacteraceae bacterium]